MEFSTVAGRRFPALGLWCCLYYLSFHEWCVTSWISQRVGCDNILGSSAMEDSCGVCKGNNSDCTVHKGLYAKHHRTNREYATAACGGWGNFLVGRIWDVVNAGGVKSLDRGWRWAIVSTIKINRFHTCLLFCLLPILCFDRKWLLGYLN